MEKVVWQITVQRTDGATYSVDSTVAIKENEEDAKLLLEELKKKHVHHHFSVERVVLGDILLWEFL